MPPARKTFAVDHDDLVVQITDDESRTLINTRASVAYHSASGAVAETRHVFLDGNDLPARLAPGFHVAELGLGTGLNLLALARCAEDAGVDGLRYTGFEAYPLDRSEIARALKAFPDLRDLVQVLLAAWSPDGFAARIGPVEARMITGDARDTLPAWQGRADAWFLDGFSPVPVIYASQRRK